MRIFNKVAILGVGLIGGSLALAIKKKGLANELIGVSRHKNSLWLAKKRGAIDKGSQDISIIKDADLVVLATPVRTLLKLAPKIFRVIKKDCIVTDVGSTKQEIVYKLRKIFSRYVGTHPLAGSEKQGMANAHPDIFRDSLCIFTTTQDTDKDAQERLKKLWTEVGARVVFLSPARHDKILSFVSHLPHIVAFSLMLTVPKEYLEFSSTGLKDATRIAASDVKLWCDIFLSNQKNTVKAIDLLQGSLSKIRAAVKNKDEKRLRSILKEAKAKRDRLS